MSPETIAYQHNERLTDSDWQPSVVRQKTCILCWSTVYIAV